MRPWLTRPARARVTRRRLPVARRRDDQDQGFSLAELLVSMTIFAMLMGITVAVLISVMYQSRASQARALAIEDMRLGLSQIDRQVRSGDVILNPQNEPFSAAGVPP